MNIFKVIEVHLMEVQEVKVQFFCYTWLVLKET